MTKRHSDHDIQRRVVTWQRRDGPTLERLLPLRGHGSPRDLPARFVV
jgi:hypothetical protein